MIETHWRTGTAAILCALYAGPANAYAQTPAEASSYQPSPAHSVEDAQDAIVVTGHPPVDFAILSSTNSIAGDELVADTRGQIGDTLANLPGVSATSFAPGASRPVLRGFSGDRVAVLIDGIGSIDASTVSVDHAVVFDALSVDHIDVFHGPAALIFGSNAIGGAVNALDTRIPRKVPDAIEGTVISGYGSAADERSAGAALTVPLADRLAFRIDGNWRKSDDLRTGGRLVSEPLRDELLAEADDLLAAGQTLEANALESQATLTGHVPNSAARSTTFGAGIAFIDTQGDLGISVQRFDTRYGIPSRPGSGDEGDVSIDLAQTRVDMRGSLKLNGLVDSVQFRGAYGDYEHAELEGSAVGTQFNGQGIEFRTDVIQSDRNGWRGRSGVHFVDRSLDITGDEAFTPDYRVEGLGLFTLQSYKLGSGFTLEGAVRFESTTTSANAIGFARSFDLWSGAAGISWDSGSGWSVGANYVRGARAPSPEELLSDGVHVATQSYELGNPTFGKETSNGAEAYVRYSGNGTSLSLTGYVTDFKGYIASMPNGDEREGFPVYAYRQLPARYYGFEASGNIKAMEWDNGSLTLEAAADYTHAQLKNLGPAPLIPPLRLRGGVGLKQDNLRAGAQVEWNARQDRITSFEFPVPAFTLVNLSADWHPAGEDGPLTLTLAADNLLDTVGRRAASVTRDFVPLPGRDLRITAKFDF